MSMREAKASRISPITRTTHLFLVAGSLHLHCLQNSIHTAMFFPCRRKAKNTREPGVLGSGTKTRRHDRYMSKDNGAQWIMLNAKGSISNRQHPTASHRSCRFWRRFWRRKGRRSLWCCFRLQVTTKAEVRRWTERQRPGFEFEPL